jgi:hypothetical protein
MICDKRRLETFFGSEIKNFLSLNLIIFCYFSYAFIDWFPFSMRFSGLTTRFHRQNNVQNFCDFSFLKVFGKCFFPCFRLCSFFLFFPFIFLILDFYKEIFVSFRVKVMNWTLLKCLAYVNFSFCCFFSCFFKSSFVR